VEIGKIYRYLATSGDPLQADENFQTALDYFTQAVNINKQLGIGNPIPYLARGKVYAQRGNVGDFFLAIQEVEKALELNPGSADVFAQLGLTYQQARNYEGAIEALRCALDGCTPEQSCIIRQDCDDPTRQYTIQPLALTDTTVVYFYTYGSVLAALSKPTNNFCADAARIFSQLRSKYGQDDFVMSFVLAGESICSNEPTPTQTATGSSKNTPAAPTPQITPTP
jgi:tetratricopeptide (TPR) repeat protein